MAGSAPGSSAAEGAGVCGAGAEFADTSFCVFSPTGPNAAKLMTAIPSTPTAISRMIPGLRGADAGFPDCFLPDDHEYLYCLFTLMLFPSRFMLEYFNRKRGFRQEKQDYTYSWGICVLGSGKPRTVPLFTRDTRFPAVGCLHFVFLPPRFKTIFTHREIRQESTCSTTPRLVPEFTRGSGEGVVLESDFPALLLSFIPRGALWILSGDRKYHISHSLRASGDSLGLIKLSIKTINILFSFTFFYI